MSGTGDIALTAEDGVCFTAYEARPSGTARGGLIVLQEIFGVNEHIRAVTDGFAADGFHAIAPALYDRITPNVALGYDDVGMKQGIDLVMQARETALTDIAASIAYLTESGVKVAAIGYCWGGSLVWRAVAAFDTLAAGIAYYGGELPRLLDLTPQAPVMAHFGARDAMIPMDGVRAFEARHPDVASFVYDADHGFNCDQRGQYDADAASLARQRSLDFLAAQL